MPSRTNGHTAEMEAVRTLALVGASAAGKTSLAEALLHKAGAIGARGSIERGSTVSDHDPLERRLQHSLNASVMHLTHAGTREVPDPDPEIVRFALAMSAVVEEVDAQV